MTPPPPAPIPPVATIDEVIEAISSIIDWSFYASSRLGYFAALYKRITSAVGVAIDDGAFEDGPLMERFDVAFATRYFDAVNGHFHPDKFPRPTKSWQVTFDEAARAQPIMLQHMFAGISAHILLDLGIIARDMSPRLPNIRNDFDTINAVLASPVNSIVKNLNELSPALAEVYEVLRHNEIFVINEAVRGLRDSAWRFGSLLAAEPGFARPATIWVRDRQIAAQTMLSYDPPPLVAPLLASVAARENRDVVENLRVLDEIASVAAPIATAL